MDARVINASVAAILTALVGFYPYLRRRNDLTRLFAASNSSLAIWNLGDVLVLIPESHRAVLFLFRLNYIAGVFAVWYFFRFIYAFAKVPLERDRYLWNSIKIYGFCLIPLSLTPSFVANIDDATKPFKEIPGSLYPLFIIFLTGGYGFALYRLFREFRTSVGDQRMQLKYMFLALFFIMMEAVCFFVSLYEPRIPPIYFYLQVVYGVIIAYAILHHRLLDIQLVLRDTTVHFLTASLLGVVACLMGLSLASREPSLAVIVAVVSMGALMVMAYEPLRKAIQPAIDRIVFSNRFGYLEELSQLPNDILEFTNLNEMLKFLVTRLKEAAKLERVRIFMYDPGHQSYVETMAQSEGTEATKEETNQLAETDPLVQLLRSDSKLWTQEDFNQAAHQDAQAELKSLEGAACFPVNKENNLLGVVVLGRKRSGELFNQKDLQILKALRLRLENFLGQAMVITQEALNMVKDSHDMKNDVNALKGRVTWRAMRIAGWRQDFEKQAQILEGTSELEKIRTAFGALKAQALEWFQEADRSRSIEDQAIGRLSHRLKNWAEYGRVVSEGFRGSRAMEAIEVGEAARLAVERWTPHAEKKNLKLTAQTNPNLVVWGERSLVEQVIENLIDNAIKATAQGKVEVFCRSDRAGVLLEVRDSGCGIPPEDLTTIFEKPFYQGKGRQQLEQSTGVGLYLVSQYVRSLGGKVWAESQVGQGSTFFVQLPRHDQERKGVAA